MSLVGTLLIALLAILVLAFLVLGASALLSLDWHHRHRAATRALPAFDPNRDAAAEPSSDLVTIAANGLEFRARLKGLDNEGPAVMLLHGFPQTSAMFVPLIDAAAEAGYRVVAFDQRGYSPGARPREVASYAVDALAQDALSVADALGLPRFHLVGHDWGAGVGWSIVGRHPERLLSWTSLSIPHVAAFAAGLVADPDQRRRSRYMLFFRMPWLPEIAFLCNGQALLRRLYAPMPENTRREYLSVLAEPGAMTAALNWYRAARREDLAEAAVDPHTEVPFLFVWGNGDPAVSPNSVAGQRPLIRGPFRELELNAGHWLMEEATEPVIHAVLEHLRTNDPAPLSEGP